MDREKAIAMANKAARKRKQERKTPAEEQIKKLFSKPCVIRWSDGSESRAAIGDIFYTEEAYDRYKAYKESGKPYPIEVNPLEDTATLIFPEDPDGERELFQKICNEFTSALRQFVGEAPTRTQKDPLQLADEATTIFNQQAEETQQELQRMADEAQDAINKGAGL